MEAAVLVNAGSLLIILLEGAWSSGEIGRGGIRPDTGGSPPWVAEGLAPVFIGVLAVLVV